MEKAGTRGCEGASNFFGAIVHLKPASLLVILQIFLYVSQNRGLYSYIVFTSTVVVPI